MTDILTLTAFFDDRDKALRASDRLVAAGLPRTRVQVVSGHMDETGIHSGSRSLKDLALHYVLPEPERRTYAEAISRGGHLVCATDLPADMQEAAIAALEEEGATDIEERAQLWETEGQGAVPPERRGTTRDVAWTDPHDDDLPKQPEEGASVGANLSGRRPQAETSGEAQGRRRVRSWFHEGP